MPQPQVKRLSDYQTPEFTCSHVDLNFNLYDTQTEVTSILKITRCGSHQKPLVLDGEDLKLVALELNGKDIMHAAKVTETCLSLSTDLDAFELRIVTEVNPLENTKLEGLYLSDGAFCTQCEAEGFRRMTYYFDRPDVLATFKVRAEGESSSFPDLLSNGNRIEEGLAQEGRHYVIWEDPYPKPCYLFALVAGNFDCLNDSFTTQSGREVLLQVFVDKGQLPKSYHAMASLKKSMKWDEERFGLEYDLDIYMIVAVDFFNMGAMENKGLNVFNSKFVLADKESATDKDYHAIESVIGHEYFHNWTGNRVTCRDWFQLSLKEGLTVFRDQEFSSDVGSRTVNRIEAVKAIRSHQFAEDAGPMAHPIRPESVIEMNNFYTSTVYEKGAEVIRMMHTLIGEDAFQAGMRLYFERHDGQAVTCDDFIAAMSDASGIDLTQFKRWYAQAGTPIVHFEEHYDVKEQRYEMVLKQHTPATADGSAKAPLHIPVVIDLLDSSGKSISLKNNVLSFTEAQQSFIFENIQEKPVACLFCNFSAPIKLEHQYSGAELAHMLRFSRYEMSRWDAGQSLAKDEIIRGVQALQQGKEVKVSPVFLEAMQEVLTSKELDPAFISEVMQLPSEAALAEDMQELDTENLYWARQSVKLAMTETLEQDLLKVYQDAHQSSAPDAEAVSARALKNTCLSYLGLLPKHVSGVIQQQFLTAKNMTEQMGALQAANTTESPLRAEMMQAFEQQWNDFPLVMDKWFALHATLPCQQTIQKVESLLKHTSFSLQNPNRVRALVGSFASGNPYLFHAQDGSGYAFLVEQLKVLNTINPQIAARLITPLTQWKKLPEAKQNRMKEHLKDLMQLDHLAKDLYEKAYKALQQ